MSKLILLTEYYAPQIGRVSGLTEDLVEELSSRGHQITVICGNQTYRASGATVPDRPPEGAEVVRCPSTRLSRSSHVGRLVNWATLLSAMSCRLWRCVPTADAILSIVNPIPLHWLTAAIPGPARMRRVTLLWDLLPDSAVASNMVRPNSVATRIPASLNAAALRHLDTIIVPGRDMKEHLLASYRVPAERVAVVSNWCDGSRLCLDAGIEFPRTLDPKAPFTLLLAGHLGRAQRVDGLKELARAIEQEEGLSLRIVGLGPDFDRLRAWLVEHQLAKTQMLDFCEGPAFGHLLSTANCGLVSLSPPFVGVGVPSRTYTYLSAGMPVIAFLPEASEVALQLRMFGSGVAAQSPGDILAAIRAWRTNPTSYKNASAAALSSSRGPLSKQSSVDHFERLLFGQGTAHGRGN